MSTLLVSHEHIENKIYFIRGRRVMVDRDLAFLYGVETRVLNQAVRRNKERFPEDFMFQLTLEETKNWMSQIVISNKERMGLRKCPLVFTEHGILMLSSVLNSSRAVQVNIAIMRAFVKLREILMTHKELNHKLDELERKVGRHDGEIKLILEAIRRLMEPPSEKKKLPFGFHTVSKES